MAFRILVKEYRIENPSHTVSIHKDTHGSGPSLYFQKRPSDQIGGSDLPLQGYLDLLNLPAILPQSFL